MAFHLADMLMPQMLWSLDLSVDDSRLCLFQTLRE